MRGVAASRGSAGSLAAASLVAGSVGNGRISISVVIGGSRRWGDETGRNEKTLPPRKGLVKRRLISQEDLPGLGTLPALRR
jgi:hypothetical protein